MAATRGDKVPAIILKHSENFADFQAIILSKQFKVSNTIGKRFALVLRRISTNAGAGRPHTFLASNRRPAPTTHSAGSTKRWLCSKVPIP